MTLSPLSEGTGRGGSRMNHQHARTVAGGGLVKGNGAIGQLKVEEIGAH